MNSVRSFYEKMKLALPVIGLSMLFTSILEAQPAFRINGKLVTVDQLYRENEGKFFELEKQKYELIDSLAKQQYLDNFWAELAKKSGGSSDQAREAYISKNAVVSDAEIKQTLDQFKDHPRLKELSEKEKTDQVRDYLVSVKTRDVVDDILQEAVKANKLVVLYTKPKEPRFKVSVSDTDPVKYAPGQTKPVGCSGSKCAITVVEFSEFQCPFCERVLPTVERILNEYKGKIRWIVKDFPLGFHDRARPAAVAAHCASDQGKFWDMYDELFSNQRKLADEDLKKYAKNIGLNMDKFNTCFDNPAEKLAIIEKNYREGEQVGVTGTPAFFINGRRLSGALPYEEFRRVLEEELAALASKS